MYVNIHVINHSILMPHMLFKASSCKFTRLKLWHIPLWDMLQHRDMIFHMNCCSTSRSCFRWCLDQRLECEIASSLYVVVQVRLTCRILFLKKMNPLRLMFHRDFICFCGIIVHSFRLHFSFVMLPFLWRCNHSMQSRPPSDRMMIAAAC